MQVFNVHKMILLLAGLCILPAAGLLAQPQQRDFPRGETIKEFKIKSLQEMAFKYDQELSEFEDKGMLRTKREYDRNGNETLEELYSITNGDLYSSIVKEFDAEGKLVYKKTDQGDGESVSTYRYNKKGLVVEIENRIDGYFYQRRKKTYTGTGKLAKEVLITSQGDTSIFTWHKEGDKLPKDPVRNHRRASFMDGQGRQTSCLEFDPAGRVMKTEHREYTSFGKVKMGMDTVFLMGKTQVQKHACKYNSMGYEVEYALISMPEDTLLKRISEYDDEGRLVAERSKQGTMKYSYSEKGLISSLVFYNKEEKPVYKVDYRFTFWK